MTQATQTHPEPAIGDDVVLLTVPADGGYLGVLRTATAGLAARLHFALARSRTAHRGDEASPCCRDRPSAPRWRPFRHPRRADRRGDRVAGGGAGCRRVVFQWKVLTRLTTTASA